MLARSAMRLGPLYVKLSDAPHTVKRWGASRKDRSKKDMAKLYRLVVRKRSGGFEVLTHLRAARGRHRIGTRVRVTAEQKDAFLNDEGIAERLGLK